MKKSLFFVLWALTALPLLSQSTFLTGTWVSDLDSDSIIFEFSPDGFLTLTETEAYPGDVPEIIGGANFVYEDLNGDSILTDFKYKTDPAKPDHLYFVLYKAGTNTPYLILPLLMNRKNDNTIEITMLEADADNADEEGILYEGEKDWALAAQTIEAAKKPEVDKNDFETFILKKVK